MKQRPTYNVKAKTVFKMFVGIVNHNVNALHNYVCFKDKQKQQKQGAVNFSINSIIFKFIDERKPIKECQILNNVTNLTTLLFRTRTHVICWPAPS